MSVRVTRKIRRVLEALAVGEYTVAGLVGATKISPPHLWPIIDRLHDNGWIEPTGHDTFKITDIGRAGLKADTEAVETARQDTPPAPRPRSVPAPRPPYTQRRAPWPRGDGRRR